MLSDIKHKIEEQIKLHEAASQRIHSDNTTSFWVNKIIQEAKIESLKWVLAELEK